VLLVVFEGRTRQAFIHAVAALGIAVLVALPWAAVVVSRHGLETVVGVPSNGPDPLAALLAVFAGRVTGVPFTDPLAILGAALAVLCLIRRQWLLPVWFFGSLLLSYQYAMIPFGMLIGGFAIDIAALVAARRTLDASTAPASTRWIPVIGITVLMGCFVVEGFASAATVLNPGAPVHALTADRREAMVWVAANPPLDARVAVITGSEWSGDPDSEWFPQLTGRQSVATVQGSEWMGPEAFEAQVIAHRSLQACVITATAACIDDWLAQWPAFYLYLPTGSLHGPQSPADCCAELRAALATDGGYTLLYDGPGASIFRVSDQPVEAP
jgi:hypothetical protein